MTTTIPLFAVGAGRRQLSEHWYQSRDGDDDARELFNRHYSKYQYKDGREPKLFVGPGEKLVLTTFNGDALFVWRKFISDCPSGQLGVNCAVFRNEGATLSSALILEAEQIGHARWPRARYYTFVNPRAIKSANPGCCFKKAGWRVVGTTKARGYVILAKEFE